MPVTRMKYDTVYTLYVHFNWTAKMIQGMVDLKPWEIGAIIEAIDEEHPQSIHTDTHSIEDIRPAA